MASALRAQASATRSSPATPVLTPAVSPAVAKAEEATARGGAPLPDPLRAQFAPRFGRDLSDIRIHTGAAAGAAAEGLGATAFTRGAHIAFAPGGFDPGSRPGRRVLAHEIAHSFQPGAQGTVRRTCPTDPSKIPPGDSKAFEAAVDAITGRSEFKGLKTDAQKLRRLSRQLTGEEELRLDAPGAAQDIIDGARASACPMFYIDLLKQLFDLPEPVAKKADKAATGGGTSREEMAVATRADMLKAFNAEQTRLAPGSTGETHKDDEEKAAAGSGRSYSWVKNKDLGKSYQVDARNPADIYVRVKILLKPRGGGTAADVANVSGIQDAIEKAMSQPGYTVDIDFVTSGGSQKDVFTIGVDPSDWPESQNWVKGPGTLAHEAQHVLNNEDRYSYLSHATNPAYNYANRLNLFRRQMVRPVDTLAGESMMQRSGSNRPLNEQDICATAFANREGKDTGMEAQYKDCLLARFALRPASDIQRIARMLTHPYAARNAGLLDILASAYLKRPEKERIAGCTDIYAPECGQPPKEDFGVTVDISLDAAKNPIPRPHKPPPVSDLKKTRRSP
ncbi:DUF4157 domain-containing protein [Salipiger sp. H15]|uniref:DUF4157 domain-containing protein n=1 Tax=Alloyangia sp. H15 TaxID=3029062 RepID=A0AAU8AM77_9RHOB